MSPDPLLLTPTFHETVWGVQDLSPWFDSPGGRIGEVWFEAPQLGRLPILVKFIFTSERLSVQVHPDDAYARQIEGASGGKTEMWYVLRAAPGAKLAAGFVEPVSPERAREAAQSGEIEQLLRWWPVETGQVYLLPAGTVHALGAGITVCEIQQNNQITYRLYDYGRPRELHLEKGLEVAFLGPHPGPITPQGDVLAACPHFVTERLELSGEAQYETQVSGFELLIVLEGAGRLAGQDLRPGQVWYLPPGSGPWPLEPAPRLRMLRTRLP
ncbi:MAG: class I mannose-6-phosphate isomerase [Bryobacteraceae bacterium]|nr:class I mannose-6-phosphate isomerase [Bryobacteraceae bacterium]